MSGLLLDTSAKIVQKMLWDMGFATRPEDNLAWPLYYHYLPDKPDDAIVIYDTAGILEGRTHTDGFTQEKYGLTVTIRANAPVGQITKFRQLLLLWDTQVLRRAVILGANHYNVQAITRKSETYTGKELPTTERTLANSNVIASIDML